ncbi:RAxF-45 family protein [Paenibacillus sp. NPDC058071]
MKLEKVYDRISQLMVAMAGIIHAQFANGIGLSIFNYTILPFARRRLP